VNVPLPGAVDDVDGALVRLLEADGRTTYADLAAELGLSGEVVRARLKKMLTAGIVQITSSVNPAIVGCSMFALVGIKVSGSARQIACEIANLSSADFVVCTAGSFDVLIELVCRDAAELLAILDEQVRSRPDVVSSVVYQYLSVKKYEPSSSTRPSLGSSANAGNAPVAPARVDLDATDRRLVHLLQRDGRATFAELAEATGLPYTSARRRIMRLFQSDVLQTVTLTNPLLYRSRVQATVGVRVHGPISNAIEALRTVPNVDLIIATTGTFDIVLEVTCADVHELAGLVGDTIRSLPGIGSTETYTYLEILKLPYTWSGQEG
jgi:DNA-binding Lrp family transcriptional regulator